MGMSTGQVLWTLAAGGLVALGSPCPGAAQTDYYNTDAGRPVLIEDAYPTERYAFELQIAPLRIERVGRGVYNWGVEPEIAYGILPRTHIEVGFPIVFLDGAEPAATSGLAGIDISVLHNLNVETEGLPAFGVAAETVLPVGSLAPARFHPSVKGIATRTFHWARFHVNGRFTFGGEAAEVDRASPEGPEEPSRWRLGMAADRTFPLRSLLIIGEVYAERPLSEGHDVEWNTAAGFRMQRSPRLAFDAGIGRRLTGDARWFVTFGAAYQFAIRSLIPVG